MKAKELRQLIADMDGYVDYNGRVHDHDPTWCFWCMRLKPRIAEALE